MTDIVEKISERYADEIASLPSIGSLTSFIIIATGAYMIESHQLHWLPPVSEIFGNNLSIIFDKENGVLSKSSLGALIFAAAGTVFLKYIYSIIVRKIFRKLSSTNVLSSYVLMANNAASQAGIDDPSLRDGYTTFLSDELKMQRRAFQRIHGAAFVVFTIFMLSGLTIFYLNSIFISVTSMAALLWLEFMAIKQYLTRLFPSLCVVWATRGKAARFGEE